ncbi:hypothetical protein HAP94_17890 [Acidithiobacillus ferrivorans]|nr:hypothetical protein [Acidithiobacillus ferrivorans]
MLTNPTRSLRNINFDCLHQRQGHHDITADVDLVHLDPILKVCLLVDFKYATSYKGMSRGQRELYESMAVSMTAGGMQTVAVIALHSDDVYETPDIDAAHTAIHEVYEPSAGRWMRPSTPIALPDFVDSFKSRVQAARAADMLRRIRH